MSDAQPLSFWQRFWTNRLLDGRLSPGRARKVRASIAKDPAWRAAYDALRKAERGDAGLSAGAKSHLESLILDTPAAPAARRWLAMPAIGGAIAAAAVLFIVLLPPGEDEWRTRGSGDAFGIAIRCLVGDEVRGSASARPDEAAVLRCPRDGVLVFTGQNRSAAPVYLFVVGREGSEPRWLPPFDERSLVVPAEQVEHVFSSGAGVDFEGSLAVTAIFSPAPLERAAVEEAVRAGGARLSLKPSAQARVEVRVE